MEEILAEEADDSDEDREFDDSDMDEEPTKAKRMQKRRPSQSSAANAFIDEGEIVDFLDPSASEKVG